jgi:hypothetical protein
MASAAAARRRIDCMSVDRCLARQEWIGIVEHLIVKAATMLAYSGTGFRRAPAAGVGRERVMGVEPT